MDFTAQILEYEDSPTVIGPNSSECVLQPDEEATFEWAYGHTLKEWRDDADMFMEITIHSSTADGVIDYAFLQGNGRPIAPIPDQASAFRLSASSEVGVMAHTLRRWYPWEGTTVTPPWNKSA